MKEVMHDLPNILLAGIAAVTAALCWVANALWKRSEECERDRQQLWAHLFRILEDRNTAAKNRLPDDQGPLG